MVFGDLKYIQKHIRNITTGALFSALFLGSTSYVVYHAVTDRQAVQESQTPINEVKTFQVSGVDVRIKGEMTDKKKDVLILTLEVNENGQKLPYGAENYWVVTTSDISGESIPCFFGRMSTDGDMFLIIPYPDKEMTYNIGIYNTASTASQNKNNDSSSIRVDKGTQAKVISDITSDISPEKSNNFIERKETDTIGFNATLESKIKGKNYQITTLDVDSLLIEKGDVVSFDFKTFYELAYRKVAVDEAQSTVDKLEKDLEDKNKDLLQVQKILDKEPEDEEAQSQLSSLNSSIQSITDDLTEANATLNEVRKMKYKASDFDNYTTKMYKID